MGKITTPAFQLSNVQIYESLNYRHWDEWEDGAFNHVFYAPVNKGKPSGKLTDIMPGEPYDCPTKPFGDEADYIWSPDSKHIIYATKKAYGTEYAISTNTDLYEYDITTGTAKNLTEGMMGYDLAPAYNSHGVLAWLSMKRNGYESDKNDIVVDNGTTRINLTQQRDDIHVGSFKWSSDGNNIYFIAPVNGTEQLFVVDYPGNTRKMPTIRQLTKGDFDINEIVGEINNHLIVSRSDFNHANELYSVNVAKGDMQQLTFTNNKVYSTLALCKTERRFVTTTDNKQMLVWVVYPPNFDAAKKYPALLYCQGGPQAALTQFYSFRWNLQLIASQGYIVVAPDRRGMPGFGTQWNEQVSKDWGGQVLQDYLSAIDDVSKESFVDTSSPRMYRRQLWRLLSLCIGRHSQRAFQDLHCPRWHL